MTALTGIRLSELARCPRMCACRGLGYEEREPSEMQRRYQARGQLFERYAYHQFTAKHGENAVEWQREITSPLGVGHADIYVRTEKLIVEVVSTTSEALVLAKIQQAKQYLRFDEEAERAAVYVINPSSLEREDLFPVRLTDEDRDEIDRLVGEVERALRGGELPPCSASTPSECARTKFCPFTEQAWAGWEPPPPEDVDAPHVARLVADLYHCKREAREFEAHAEVKRGEARAIEEELARSGIQCGQDYRVGPFKLRRSQVAAGERLALARARKAGIWTAAHDEVFGPFLSVSGEHERWRVERVSDEAIPVDELDEVPF